MVKIYFSTLSNSINLLNADFSARDLTTFDAKYLK